MLMRPDISAEAEIDWIDEADRIRAQLGGGRPAVQPKVGRAAPERDVQRTCIAWLRMVLPGSIVAAVPNEQRGSGRTTVQRMRFGAARKASGVLSGFPDVTVWPVSQPPFLVEMKAPKGVLSDSQRELHARLRAAGHVVIVADAVESLRLGLRQAGIKTNEAAGQPVAEPRVRRMND